MAVRSRRTSRMAKRGAASRAGLGASGAAGLLTFLGILVVAAVGGLLWASRQLAPDNPSDHSRRSVLVPEGATVAGIAALLARDNLVRSPLSITLAAHLDRDSAKRLKPGVYLIAPSESPAEILRQIAGGRMELERVVVPEGFTLRQIVARLGERHLGDSGDLLSLALTQGRTFRCAGGFTPPSSNLEGYLFPDTYTFAPDVTSRQILQNMVEEFDKQVVRAHPQVRDWTRSVIVASLVEREAEVETDRPLIAGVLYNRLRIRMPLQVDATVEYALPEHKQRLLYSDLRTRSPYNTYLHRGLPPGPICNPGLRSLEAALSPAPVDFLYYVAAPDGSHKFSRTLAGQDRNIAAVRNAAARG